MTARTFVAAVVAVAWTNIEIRLLPGEFLSMNFSGDSETTSMLNLTRGCQRLDRNQIGQNASIQKLISAVAQLKQPVLVFNFAQRSKMNATLAARK